MLTEQQRNAVHDAYTTLRAITATHGEHDDVITNMCAESERLLVEAFPEVEALEKRLDESTPST